MTEAEILEGCRRGDDRARHALYLQTSERIHRLLLRMVRDPEHALDLVQDTFIKAFTRIDQFDGRSAIATWLHRVAVTEALQHLRRQRRSINPDALWPESTDASDPAQGADVRIDIEDALAKLDPDDRAVLLLRYDGGHDYRAIATILDCAEGTVASRLHRARERLRLVLANSYCPEEDVSTERQAG
ncbi:MAG: sigma-70 family RNA polymerase sigma factor [Planctomycetes bacterium]|nr:sigma-70 family RNA polymerase sigma factor [Planctomycetota bacterium]